MPCSYNGNNELIANVRANTDFYKPVKRLNLYWVADWRSHTGIIAINPIPEPQTEVKATYLCAMIDNPLLNINGEVKMIEKNDYFLTPYVENNRTMIPLRAIFESMNAAVDWNEDTRTITATKDGTTVVLQIDSNVMDVNGTTVALDAPARIVDNRTFIPLRAVTEAFHATVDWNEALRLITIIGY